MKEVLYNYEIHTFLDILSDEELYLLEINIISNVQIFVLLSNHPMFYKFETAAETIDHSKKALLPSYIRSVSASFFSSLCGSLTQGGSSEGWTAIYSNRSASC